MAQIRFKSVADATLATCWKELLASPHPRDERLIHVNTPHLAAAMYAGEPYRLWEAGKLEASLKALAEIAASWPYIRYAERARAQGTANFRIMHLPPEDERRPWHNYQIEVLWPYFAATVGETCLVLDRNV